MANDANVEPFTKIPNRILDEICLTRLPGEVGQVLMTIARLTYGYHEDKVEISLSQFHKTTGIERSNARRAINVLESMRIIFTDRTPGLKTSYRINPDIKDWKPKPKQRADKRQTVVSSDYSPELLSVPTTVAVSSDYSDVVSSDYSTIVSSDYTSYNKKESFKERNKETHKESKHECVFASFFIEIANDFCEGVKKLAPIKKPESIELAAKILSQLGGSPEEVSNAIVWTQSHPFWQSRTLTAKSFANSYDAIKLQMNEPAKKSRTSNQATLKRMIEECTG